MAKTKSNSTAKDIRANRIANCQNCQGNPNTAETELQGRKIQYCTTCMEVTNWQEPGINKPVRTNEDIALDIKEDLTKSLDIEINTKKPIGTINFKSLK